MHISIDFDFRAVITKPLYTRGLSIADRKKLTQSGDFRFKGPKAISVANQVHSYIQEIQQIDLPTDDSLKKDLKALDQDLDKFIKIVDGRCKHIAVSYNPKSTDDEAITEACSKIYGKADGVISYEMYSRAIGYLQKLDQHLSQRAIENKGTL